MFGLDNSELEQLIRLAYRAGANIQIEGGATLLNHPMRLMILTIDLRSEIKVEDAEMILSVFRAEVG